jgi:restriction system protein
MGYGYETELGHTGQSGDGGVDGIIKEDKLGLDNIYIQAKLYENTVPIGHLRDFIGALASRKASKGVFITSSNFPSSADAFLAPVPTRVVLITGKELAELMIQYNVGVAVKETFVLKGISDEFFEEELG